MPSAWTPAGRRICKGGIQADWWGPQKLLNLNIYVIPQSISNPPCTLSLSLFLSLLPSFPLSLDPPIFPLLSMTSRVAYF